MQNIGFYCDFNGMYYRWDFYKKDEDLCKKFYYLSTSDEVYPEVTERITKTPMRVEKINKHNNYVTWKVFC